MNITEAMIEAGARAIFMRGWEMPRGFASDDDFFRERKKWNAEEWDWALSDARACLTAAIPAAEAQGAVLCVVPGEMDHMTAGTQSGPQFVTGHNACRAAVIAGRVVV